MAYKKTLIRQYFELLLKTTVTSVNSRVYSGRINPNENASYPYLTVFTKDENIVDQFTTHTERELELHIGVIVKDNDIANGDFDEVIENIMFDVEEVMSQVITVQTKPALDFFALLNSVQLVSSTMNSDNSSSSDIGGALLVYKVDYDYNLPIVSQTLEDFDVDGSIDHIQITNPGVPINDV